METTRFSGVAGRVLWGTLSLQSMLTGVLLGLTIIVSNWVLTLADAPAPQSGLRLAIFRAILVLGSAAIAVAISELALRKVAPLRLVDYYFPPGYHVADPQSGFRLARNVE